MSESVGTRIQTVKLFQRISLIPHGLGFAPDNATIAVVSGTLSPSNRASPQLVAEAMTDTDVVVGWANFITGDEVWIELTTHVDASDQNVTAEGSSTARSLEVRLAELGCNVKDYGATGLGVADDGDAIISAVAEAVSLGINHIHFPAGTYRVDVANTANRGTRIAFPSNFLVTGEGISSKIKQTGNTSTVDEFDFDAFGFSNGVSNVTIRDLYFYGENGTIDGTGFQYIQNAQASAIGSEDGHDVNNITIENCEFHNLYAFAVHCPDIRSRWKVINCRLSYCANGININCNYGVFSKNIFDHSEGFEMAGSGNVLTENVMTNVIDGGFAIGGDTSGTIREYNIIANNFIYTVDHAQGSGASGIILTDSSGRCIIANNIIYGAAGYGIDQETFLGPSYKSQDHLICGNKIKDCTYGIKAGPTGASATAVVVCDNWVEATNCAFIVLPGTAVGSTIRAFNNTFSAPINAVTFRDGAAAEWHNNKLISAGQLIHFDGTAVMSGPTFYGYAATDVVDASRIASDSVDQFVRYLGGKLEWGSGSASRDTNLYRNAANVLKTDDKLLAALGIGVGNSGSGSTPGTCVKKIEVFDASGSSLGFIAVYDAIT